MRFSIFLIFAVVALALERGLRVLLSLPWGPMGDAAPSFLLVLGVFIALSAPPYHVYWAMLLLGLMVDLSTTIAPTSGPDVVIAGPHALGFLLGGWVVVQLRNMMFREALTTMVVMTLAAGLFVTLAVMAILTLRGLPFLPTDAVPQWRTADELLQRLLNLSYTGVLALPLGWSLQRSRPLWRFAATKGSVRTLR